MTIVVLGLKCITLLAPWLIMTPGFIRMVLITTVTMTTMVVGLKLITQPKARPCITMLGFMAIMVTMIMAIGSLCVLDTPIMMPGFTDTMATMIIMALGCRCIPARSITSMTKPM